MSVVLTKTGYEINNPVDGSGNPRGSNMGEEQTWKTEIERLLGISGVTSGKRIVTAAGDVTIATSDSRVHVKKTSEAATAVNFPSIATWIAANGYRPFTLKNRMSNAALYPLSIVLSGTDTLEDSATPLDIDHREEIVFYPDDSVTPSNWEIR